MGEYRRKELDPDKIYFYEGLVAHPVKGMTYQATIGYRGEGEEDIPPWVMRKLRNNRFGHFTPVKLLYECIVESQYVPFEMI